MKTIIHVNQHQIRHNAKYVKGKTADELVFAGAKEGRSARDKIKGGRDWSNHDLRKLFAIVAMDIGVPYPVIKAALNHTSGDVTLAHYAQATPSQLRSCWDRVAAFYTRKECSTLETINEPLYAPQNESTSNLTSITQPLVFRERQESLPTVSRNLPSTTAH